MASNADTTPFPWRRKPPTDTVEAFPELGAKPKPKPKAVKKAIPAPAIVPAPLPSKNAWADPEKAWRVRLLSGDVMERDKNLREDGDTNTNTNTNTNSKEASSSKTYKARSEMNESELESLRQKRGEKRQRDKEKKKKEKEEEARRKIIAPKTSKIQLVSAELLNRVGGAEPIKKKKKGKEAPPVEERKTKEKIRFHDEEYPNLGSIAPVQKKEKVLSRWATDAISGKAISDAESGSEWETDNEKEKELEEEEEEEEEDMSPPVVVVDSAPMSYSSILKNVNKAKAVKTVQVKKAPTKAVGKAAPLVEEVAKKVKKKDPITFDLFAALQVKQKVEAKRAAKVVMPKKVLGGKIAPNKLDSTAPMLRRGKERELPKKKKLTALKAAILTARRERRLLAKEKLDAKKAEEDKKDAGETEVVKEVDQEASAEKGSENAEKVEDEPCDESSKTDCTEDAASTETKSKEENSETPEVEEVVLSPEELLLAQAKEKVHSKRFRDYCNHTLSKELDSFLRALMTDLIRFQDRQHATDPVKAKAKRRYSLGLREVLKFLRVRKVQLLVLAPDLENSGGAKGLNKMVSEMMSVAKENGIPVAFAMHRRALGKACVRKVPVACLGIMNYQGSDSNYHGIIELLPKLQEAYEDKIKAALNELEAVQSIEVNSKEVLQNVEAVQSIEVNEYFCLQQVHETFTA